VESLHKAGVLLALDGLHPGTGPPFRRHGSDDEYREVLGLYRKRDGARCLHEHGVLARFRYNDLKEKSASVYQDMAVC
jgi:hypothetical protein